MHHVHLYVITHTGNRSLVLSLAPEIRPDRTLPVATQS